jgi:hypothetical protein
MKEKNKNKGSDIRYFRTTGRKQHDFPKGKVTGLDIIPTFFI